MDNMPERPEILPSKTYKIKVPTSEHAVYLTISDMTGEDGEIRPWEIFLSSKNMESFMWITSLMRTISFVFRYAPDKTRALLEELKTVADPKDGNYFRKGHCGCILSLVADIATQIEKHMDSLETTDV